MSRTRTDTRPDPSTTPTTLAPSRRRVRRAATVVFAVLAAVLAWIVVVPLLGVELVVTGPDGAIGPVSVVAVAGAALLAGAAGWALLAVLEHVTRSAAPAWTVIAGTVLVVSLAGPLTAGTVAAMVSLIALHLIVGVVVAVGLRRSGGRR